MNGQYICNVKVVWFLNLIYSSSDLATNLTFVLMNKSCPFFYLGVTYFVCLECVRGDREGEGGR